MDSKNLMIAVREHFGYKTTEFDVKLMPDIPVLETTLSSSLNAEG